MYQSFINLLLESGFQKQITIIGPVYINIENQQIVFLTYHKNQMKDPVYLKDYEQELQNIKNNIFLSQGAKILCIVFVDDGNILENQMEVMDPSFSVWIQDEQSGKLYMSKKSDSVFSNLHEKIQNKAEEADKVTESVYEEEKIEYIKTYFSPVNIGLILINIIIFFISYFQENLLEAGVSEWKLIIVHREYYRLLTSIFLHFNWEHLFGNMLVLFLIGSFVERYIGSIRYLCVYLICGLIGNIVSFYFQIGDTSLAWSAGASGAIYGVLGFLAVILLKTKGKIEGIQGPGIYLFIIGSVFHSYQTSGVDNWAHLGGLIAGCILGIFLKRRNNKREAAN
jgi:rhomboid protease GluP